MSTFKYLNCMGSNLLRTRASFLQYVILVVRELAYQLGCLALSSNGQDIRAKKERKGTKANEEGVAFGCPRAWRACWRLVGSKRMHVRRPTSNVYNLWSICIPRKDKSSRHPGRIRGHFGWPTSASYMNIASNNVEDDYITPEIR